MLAALPKLEENAFAVIETVFAPRQIAQQLAVCVVLQSAIMSIRLLRKAGRYALTAFSHQAALKRQVCARVCV
jgi:hypothetical protein